LNKKIRKNIKHNKSSKMNKMIGCVPTRKSQRGLPAITMRVVTLGNGDPATATYNNQKLNNADIKTFIENKIKPGCQIVRLPIPPDESHSIIVEVFSDLGASNVGAMIVDWGGESTRHIKTNKWKNYTTFINCLEKKYGKVGYHEIDEGSYETACQRYETNHGQGGCSQYVENWIYKYIGKEGTYAIIHKDD